MRAETLLLALFACAHSGRRVHHICEPTQAYEGHQNCAPSPSDVKESQSSRQAVGSDSQALKTFTALLTCISTAGFVLPQLASPPFQALQRAASLSNPPTWPGVSMQVDDASGEPALDAGSKRLLDNFFYYYMRDFAQVVDKLQADLPGILQKDPNWDMFAKEFSVMDQTGARAVGLSDAKLLLKKLRRICDKMAYSMHIQVDLLIDAAAFREPCNSFKGLEFIVARWKVQSGWKVQLGSVQSQSGIPVNIEAETVLRLDGRNKIDSLRIDKWFVNGQQFLFWPEAACDSLEADLPNILTQELNLEHFAADFKLLDRTGVTVNGLSRNRRLLRLLRDFHERLSRTPLKDSLKVKTRKRLEANLDGSIDAVLIVQSEYEIDSDPSNPTLEQLKAVQFPLFPVNYGLPLTVASTYSFHSDQAGKIDSVRLVSSSINGIQLPDVSLKTLSETTVDQLFSDILGQLARNR